MLAERKELFLNFNNGEYLEMHLNLNFIFKSEFLKLLENSLIMPKELKNLQRNF